jgi:hypothetical protein
MAARKDNGSQDRADAWAERTQLYRALTDIETEIMAHRWAESHKTGHEIDWDRAVVDWTIRHGHRLSKKRR